MPGVSRINDSIEGTTSGEHSGHTDPQHGPLSITGYISGGCSLNVFVNDKQVAVIGSTTTEMDDCCGTNSGVVSGGSSTVFANGKGVARIGDLITPHNGTAKIVGGSTNVFSN